MTDSDRIHDPYRVLGIERTASLEEVKCAFREAAKQLHPDLHPGPEAEARFARVSEAYRLLVDPDRRAAFDAASSGPASEGGTEPHPSTASNGLEGVTRVVGGVLEEVREGVERRWALGKDLRYTLSLTLRESLLGCARQIVFDAPVRCSACGGRGQGGDRGVGGACISCGGEGVVVAARRFSLEIPPGTCSGQLTRIPKGGVPGARGGPEGDLFFIVEVAPHPHLTREGEDLVCRVPLPATTALGGGRLRVPTLEGSTIIEIPAGVQTGQVFRLAGRGVPRGDGHRGALRILVEVEAPASMPEEVSRLLREAEQKDPARVFPRSTALRMALEEEDE